MPYIEPHKREIVDDDIVSLCNSLQIITEKGTEGPLNYTITKLIHQLYGQIDSYQKINEIIGVLQCVQMEFYTQHARPYEEQKKQQNGDVQIER